MGEETGESMRDRVRRRRPLRHGIVRVGILGVAAAALVAPATAGVTSVAVRPLPPDRLGTVVAWQAKSKTAVVALSSGRLMTIHALRKRSIGTRVRVTGTRPRSASGRATAASRPATAPTSPTNLISNCPSAAWS